MRLTELKGKFVRYDQRPDGLYLPYVDTIAEAQGVMFLCPKCFEKNGGPVGTHRVLCWSRSRGVSEQAKPLPGRWTLDGTGLHDLTLNGDQAGPKPREGARSVLLTAGCAWHGFVTNGEVT